MFVCSVDDCGLIFGSLAFLKQHAQQHHQHDSIQCHQCDSVVNSALFGAHMQSQHDQAKLECPTCSRKFNFQKSMERHILCCKPRNQHKYVCHLCGKGFAQNRYLKQHAEMHSAPSKVCHKCGSKFRWRGSYNKHIKACFPDAADNPNPDDNPNPADNSNPESSLNQTI